MDEVQKLSNPGCNVPSPELFRIDFFVCIYIFFPYYISNHTLPFLGGGGIFQVCSLIVYMSFVWMLIYHRYGSDVLTKSTDNVL